MVGLRVFPQYDILRARVWMIFMIRWVIVGGVVGLLCGMMHADDLNYRYVNETELLHAMNQVTGYDPTATTNGARFQAEVMFALYNTVADSGRLDKALFITPDDWFQAFLSRTQTTPETAPQYSQLAFKNRQYMWVDMRFDQVIQNVKEGKHPVRAFNVMFWWPKSPNTAKSYSYQDTLSSPNLNVTNHRVITYRLLDFGDCFFFDEVDGLTGRPTTGLLGLLFKLIGEGRVVVSGMAISEDGLQIVRGTAKKAFMGVTTTATIAPDGTSDKDVPDGRPELQALEKRLKAGFDITYHPFEWSPQMDRLPQEIVPDN